MKRISKNISQFKKSGNKMKGEGGLRQESISPDVCEVTYIDQKKVSAVIKRMKSEATMQRIAETFKVLGDPTRTKIIFALSQEELCVCDIANLLGATKSAVSHQLRILRNMRLVKYRKEGKMVFYSLDDEHIKNLFNECLRHVEEDG